MLFQYYNTNYKLIAQTKLLHNQIYLASPGRSSLRRVPENALAHFWGSDVEGDEGTPRKLCSHSPRSYELIYISILFPNYIISHISEFFYTLLIFL